MLESVTRYLSLLPDGLDSHPHALVKGNIFRETSDGLLAERREGMLPPEVAALIRDPPGLGAWVPETHATCAWIATYELYVAAHGLAAFDRALLEKNRQLFASPLYKALFLVLRPEAVLAGIELRWRAFRRGTTIRLHEKRSGFARLELAFPQHLYPRPRIDAFRHGFEAGLAAAGAKGVSVVVDLDGATGAFYAATWSTAR